MPAKSLSPKECYGKVFRKLFSCITLRINMAGVGNGSATELGLTEMWETHKFSSRTVKFAGFASMEKSEE